MELVIVPSERRNLRHVSPLEVYGRSERIPSERLLDAGKKYLEYDAVVLELYLCLCRMYVHVHGPRVHFHIYEI